jgi:hypothetical protein
MAPMERVARLVAHLGSDDKLAAELNARFGTSATRQMTIRWRRGEGIGKAKNTTFHYADLLAMLDEEIFMDGATAEDYDTNSARLQRLLQAVLDERDADERPRENAA